MTNLRDFDRGKPSLRCLVGLAAATLRREEVPPSATPTKQKAKPPGGRWLDVYLVLDDDRFLLAVPDPKALSCGRVLCAADVRAVAAAVDRANGTKLDVVVRAAAGAFVGLARRVAGDDGDVQKWALSLVFESERNCTVAHHFLRDKRSVARAKRRDDLRAQLAELTMDV